jgi:hypothetical protein
MKYIFITLTIFGSFSALAASSFNLSNIANENVCKSINNRFECGNGPQKSSPEFVQNACKAAREAATTPLISQCDTLNGKFTLHGLELSIVDENTQRSQCVVMAQVICTVNW